MWHSPAYARWCGHVNGVRASRTMGGWLTDTVSLTVKLMKCGKQFQVLCLRQQRAVCLADEAAVVGMSRRQIVQERDVLLTVDGNPVVYAHTVVPMAGLADWPFFAGLGERSLGGRLFHDPLIWRGNLQYARLDVLHPLMRRAARALGTRQDSPLFARRCLYRRGKGLLLVTELFLSAIAGLKPVVVTKSSAEKQSNQ